MVKRKASLPSREEILKLVAGERTGLQQVLQPLKQQDVPSIAYMARLYGCTVYAMRKLLYAVKDEEQFKKLKWGKGRPKKEVGLTKQQKAWLTCRTTLRLQVGISLETRTKIANDRFNTNMKKEDLRKIYKEARITLQKIQSMLSPQKPQSQEMQLMEI